MKIGGIEIFQVEGALFIKKSKSSFQTGVLINIFISLLISFPIIYLLTTKKSINNLSSGDIIISLILIILATTFFIYNWKRDVKKFRAIEIRKERDNVLINNLLFCELNKIGLVTITELTDGDGASSFNIEISCGENHFPVYLDQGKKDAIAIASEIGHFLNKEVAFKKGKMIIP
ncbi:MAG TPA: hypothetical protein VK483_10120 [Chitinophagaceae bacterium]|nr:hypothetical protein [Chitinophagaceae bacterium]